MMTIEELKKKVSQDYMSYLYDHTLIDLIDTAVQSERERIKQIIQNMIEENYQAKGDIYPTIESTIAKIIRDKIFSAPQPENVCEWKEIPPEPGACIGYHRTSCGRATSLITDKDYKDEFENVGFCPFCGKPIKIKED